MRINLQKYSFRFAEQVLNSKLALKQEIEDILLDSSMELHSLSRPRFNKVLENLFIQKGSLLFEKVKKYLPNFKSAIQVPIYVIGINL